MATLYRWFDPQDKKERIVEIVSSTQGAEALVVRELGVLTSVYVVRLRDLKPVLTTDQAQKE